MKSLITKVIQFRWFVIAAVIALTAFLGLQIKNLKIVINPNTMLPQHHQNVIGTNVAEELFGSKHVVVIGVSAADGGNALTQNVLEVVQHLSEKMPAIEGVKGYTLMSVTADRAKSIAANGDELVIEPLLETPINDQNIQNLIQHLDTNPLYQGTLVSQDHKVVSVSFAISAGQGGFRQIMDQVQAVIDQNARSGVVITASGTPVFFAQVERFAQRMGFLFPIALILIGLIHFEAFRSIQGLVLPLVTAVLAVVWGLGIMGTANVPMDAFNATTPILILAVAAGHAVQILKRYYEEYDRLGNLHPERSPIDINRQAVVESLSKVAPVMIAAGGVAVIGFFSLITFDVATIRTFGIFTGLGILSALLIELTFIPALRSVLRPPKRVAPTLSVKLRLWDRVADHLSALVLKRYKAVVCGFVLVALIAGLGTAFINRENSTKSYFADDVQVRHDDAYLNSHLSGTNTLYVVFKGKDKDAIKQPANLRLIEETQRYLESLPNVGKTVSIVDLIKQMNRSLNAGQAEFNTIPETEDLVSQFLFLYSMSGDPVDFESYVDYDYQNANLIVWMKDDSSKYAETIVGNIREFVTPRLANTNMEILIGGSVPQSSALSETLVDGKQRNILQMIIVVFVVGILLFRSFIAGICLIVPLVVTVLMNFGVMGITGIPLNTPNAVSSAMAIGIGADYAIYMLYRMREELKKHNH
ncbi:MAG TPA: MMPL family transporter, partial [Cellvibrio sp.]